MTRKVENWLTVSLANTRREKGLCCLPLGVGITLDKLFLNRFLIEKGYLRTLVGLFLDNTSSTYNLNRNYLYSNYSSRYRALESTSPEEESYLRKRNSKIIKLESNLEDLVLNNCLYYLLVVGLDDSDFNSYVLGDYSFIATNKTFIINLETIKKKLKEKNY